MPKLKVPQLPEEIIMEILSRLPVKSLGQLKCVSKPWRSLISSPAFAKLHLKRAKKEGNANRVLVTTCPCISIDIEAYAAGADPETFQYEGDLWDPEKYEGNPEIVGSCDGLVCLTFYPNTIVVWNPCTGHYRDLPQPDSLPKRGKWGRGKSWFWGFGYDSRMDDYKVVRGDLLHGTSDCEAKVQIFGLKGDAWRSIEKLQCGGAVDSSAGVLSYGFLLHWLVNMENVPGKIPSIVSFDLVKEKFLEVVRLPDSILNAGCPVDLRAVGDQLHTFTDDYGIEFEAWVMKEYVGVESCWTRVVKFSNVVLPQSQYSRQLVYVTRSGKVLLYIELEGGNLILYNPDDGTFEVLVVDPDSFKTATYMESLVSPNQTSPSLV